MRFSLIIKVEGFMSGLFKQLALLGDVWVLWFLAAASVASFGLVLERAWAFRRYRLDFAGFLTSLEKALESNDLVSARRLSRGLGGLEARVALAGLESWSKGAASAEEAMTARLVIERTGLERGLVVLGTLGNNAPFVGLFGTVLGVIKAFSDLATQGSGGVAVVMEGISSALVATAFGIFVAIPAVAANNYFHAKLKRMSSNAQSLIHLLQMHLKDERGDVASRAGEN
jgi:biopolymer transport protein ExbB